MKKVLLTWLTFAIFTTINAQNCSDLFLSSYVEGYGNNRALEIYNPTSSSINLSGYTVGRFSNGATQLTGIQLPADNIEPYGTYVVVLDKRDHANGTGLETPIWNGYQLWDTCRDAVSGQPILDTAGAVVFCVQYNSSGMHLYGTVYNDFLDLEGKADAFLCPVYAVNNAMYFNGNDAAALIKGTTVAADGSNILDVVGVIGEDPGAGGWQTSTGSYVTRERTLKRKPYIQKGTGAVIGLLGDTLAYADWDILSRNTFTVLGEHGCSCDPDFVATQPISAVDFKVYPNPTNGAFSVKAAERVAKVEIYNTVGQLLQVETAANRDFVFQMNLNTANKGLHIAKIYFENNAVAVQKILVE